MGKNKMPKMIKLYFKMRVNFRKKNSFFKSRINLNRVRLIKKNLGVEKTKIKLISNKKNP